MSLHFEKEWVDNMGYRFTLESANTVANLAFGKVLSCYKDIYYSEERYHEFLHFLDRFHENMYSNEHERYIHNIRRIRETLHTFEHYKREPRDFKYDDTFLHFHKGSLDALNELSRIFDRCKIKSLLLPSMGNTHDDYFMTSRDTLRKLARKHPGDSCLILQPEDHPRKATIFDAFPNFDVALKQADLWPAVLFWDTHEDYAFVPVKYDDELRYLYEIISYEKHPIRELKRVAETKKKKNYYLFQLSDLHFGTKNIDDAERRLKTLIKSQFSSLDYDDNVGVIVTGDVVDSPQKHAENDYRDFAEFIEGRIGKKPIRILGNHDVNPHGLAFFHGNQKLANMIGEYPKIEVLDDLGVILLLFNSNTNGSLAEGEIGTSQMSEMGNLLDEIDNLENYLLIAVMHHHLLPIPKPDYYDEKWYKRIIPKNILEESLKLVDADLFMEWLKKRNVQLVLHGHKHIPYIAEQEGVHVVSCGSSTGKITHKEKGKTFISYNIIKISGESVTCTQFAEELLGAGEENIQSVVLPIRRKH